MDRLNAKEAALRAVLTQLQAARDKLETCLPDTRYQTEFVAWLDVTIPVPARRLYPEYDALDKLMMVIIDVKKTLALTIADRKKLEKIEKEDK